MLTIKVSMSACRERYHHYDDDNIHRISTRKGLLLPGVVKNVAKKQ